MIKVMSTGYNHAKKPPGIMSSNQIVIGCSFTYDLLRLCSEFSCFQFCLHLDHTIAL